MVTSAKFKHQQQKSKWTQTGITCTESYVNQVMLLHEAPSTSTGVRSLCEALLNLCRAHATYSEQELLKDVQLAVTNLVQTPGEVVCAADAITGIHGTSLQQGALLILSLMLFPGSKPLHKHLLSTLRAIPEEQMAAVRMTFVGWLAAMLVAPNPAEALPSGLNHDAFAQASGEQEVKAESHCNADSTAQGDADSSALLGTGSVTDTASLPAFLQSVVSLFKNSTTANCLVAGSDEKDKPHALPCAAALGSLLEAPQWRDQLRSQAAKYITALCSWLCLALARSEGGAAELQQCVVDDSHDAIRAMLLLLQAAVPEQDSTKDSAAQTSAGAAAVMGKRTAVTVAHTCIYLLQCGSLPRETMVLLGSVLWLVICVPASPPAEAAHVLQRLLLAPSGALPDADADKGARQVTARSAEGHTGLPGMPSTAELSSIGPIGRLCMARGIISVLTVDELCWTSNSSSASGYLVLVEYALYELKQPGDSQRRYGASNVLLTLLNRQQQCLRLECAKHASSFPTAQQLEVVEEDTSDSASCDASTAPVHEAAASLIGMLLQQDHVQRILSQLQSSWEDTSPQTAFKLRHCFEALLDVLLLQQQLRSIGVASQDVCGIEVLKGLATTFAVAASPTGGKTQFQVLSSLVQRLGVRYVLDAHPSLLPCLMQTLTHNALCSSATQLLKQVLTQLHAQSGASSSKDDYASWRRHWLLLLVDTLHSNNCILRSNCATYALPTLMKIDYRSYGDLIRHLRDMLPQSKGTRQPDDGSWGGTVVAMVQVMKTARRLGIWTQLEQFPGEDGACERLPPWVLPWAARRGAEDIQEDMLALLVEHPRPSAPITTLELDLIFQIVQQNMRATSLSLRNKVIALLGKFLIRVNMAAAAAQRAPRQKPKDQQKDTPDFAVQGTHDVAAMSSFCQRLCRMALLSLYPGASHYRRFMSVQILLAMLQTWGSTAESVGWHALQQPEAQGNAPSRSMLGIPQEHREPRVTHLRPLCSGFMSASTSYTMLGLVLDSWDQLREGAKAALLLLPSPLPGVTSRQSVQQLVHQASMLLSSPRERDVDAGSTLLSTLFVKYVQQLQWTVCLAPAVAVSVGAEECMDSRTSGVIHSLPTMTAQQRDGRQYSSNNHTAMLTAATLTFLDGYLLRLKVELALAEKDLLAACHHGFAHGSLLALKGILPTLRWTDIPQDLYGAAANWVQQLLRLTLAISDVALPLVMCPQDHSVGAEEVFEGHCDADGAEHLGPDAQVLMTGCWLTVKEVSLLLGMLAKLMVPDKLSGELLLSASDLDAMWAYFLRLATTVKHNGATERSQPGLLALAQACFRHPQSSVQQYPATCLEAVFQHMCRPGQCQDDVIRRSAGLPFSIKTIFQAASNLSHKSLLHRGMMRLSRLAWTDIAQPFPVSLMYAALGNTGAKDCDTLTGCPIWSQVHAINVLKLVMQDKELMVGTSGYLDIGVQVAVLCMGSKHWPVRNSASQLFSALVVRLTGAKNPHTAGLQSISHRTISAEDFFQRYPLLHRFFLQELTAATAQLQTAAGQPPEKLAPVPLHPSLYPVMVLLSRLRPGDGVCQATLSTSDLSPSALVQPILLVAKLAPAMYVRKLAGRALVPLMPTGHAMQLLLQLLQQLPEQRQQQQDQNELHGILTKCTLLMTSAVVRSSALDGHAPDHSLHLMVHTALRALSLRWWLISGCTAAANRLEAVNLLQQLLGHRYSSTSGMDGLTREVVNQCAAILNSATVSGSRGDHMAPMWSTWLKKTAVLYIDLVIRGGQLSMQSKLITKLLLECPVYEIRGGLLKQLCRHYCSLNNDQLAVPGWLCHLLLKQAEHESHRKTLSRALQLLQRAQACADITGAQMWKAAACVRERTDNPEVAESCLGLMAAAVGRSLEATVQPTSPDAAEQDFDSIKLSSISLVPGDGAITKWQAEAVEQVMDQIKVLGDAGMPVSSRLAAVHAMEAAGCLLFLPAALQQHIPANGNGDGTSQAGTLPNNLRQGFASVPLTAWQVLWQLLEDEDGTVQAAAVRVAASAGLSTAECHKAAKTDACHKGTACSSSGTNHSIIDGAMSSAAAQGLAGCQDSGAAQWAAKQPVLSRGDNTGIPGEHVSSVQHRVMSTLAVWASHSALLWAQMLLWVYSPVGCHTAQQLLEASLVQGTSNETPASGPGPPHGHRFQTSEQKNMPHSTDNASCTRSSAGEASGELNVSRTLMCTTPLHFAEQTAGVDQTNCTNASHVATSAMGPASWVRRLFDVEVDNDYVEAVHTAQCAARGLLWAKAHLAAGLQQEQARKEGDRNAAVLEDKDAALHEQQNMSCTSTASLSSVTRQWLNFAMAEKAAVASSLCHAQPSISDYLQESNFVQTYRMRLAIHVARELLGGADSDVDMHMLPYTWHPLQVCLLN